MEISPTDLINFETDFNSKVKYKVVQGALRKSGIIDISGNQNAMNKLPFKFNHSIKGTTKITDQANSGRCWIFAGLNVIRQKLINKYYLPSDFQLSQAYMFRCDKLEKCNAAIELIYELAKQGKRNDSIEYVTMFPNILSDGGTWCMFTNIVEKYGVVPKDIYPECFQSMNTMRMNNLLNTTVLKTSDVINAKMSISEFRDYKRKIIGECHRIINMCLGNAPKKFSWTFNEKQDPKEYTPKLFHDKIVKPLINVKNFVSICNVPIEDYNQILAIEYLHNVLNNGDNVKKTVTNSYLNLEMDVFKKSVFKSIEQNIGVWFACDINQFWMNRTSILDQKSSNLKDIFDIDFTLSKRASLETRTNVPNHAMMIAGCQKDEKEFKRWKIENSHGTYNDLNGYITMSDKWFNEYVICAAVPIDCLPIAMRKIVKEQTKIKRLPHYSVLGIFAD